MTHSLRIRRGGDPRDIAARALFRRHGFDVESVSFIRSRDDEFMAIKVWPAREVADVVEFLTQPANRAVKITRIHVNEPSNPYLTTHARIYVAWDEPEPEPRTHEQNVAEWERIERALDALDRSPADSAPCLICGEPACADVDGEPVCANCDAVLGGK